MADRHDPPDVGTDDPALAVAARHALHDEVLIAAFATDGDAADDPARARSLIERCPACRELHADIAAIGGALRSVPSAEVGAASEQAPRDFRLSVATANRLRPGSVVLRLRDRIREAIASFGRPVGMSLASLGVVGLLLGTLTLNGTAGLREAPADAGLGGAMGAANASAGPGTTAELHFETPDAGWLSGSIGSPRETERMSDTTSTASPATADPPSAAASPAPVVPGPNAGPLASTGPTVAALVVVGSFILLVGGVALIVVGSRRREPIPGR